MVIDNKIKEMQENAIEMGAYYYKGFGNTIQGILANAELYLMEERKEKLVRSSYEWFNEIEELYKKIPFENLHGRAEYYPLFVVNRMIPKFREAMDQVFQNNQKDHLRNLETEARTIVEVGRLYWDSFMSLCRQIRCFPEAKDFRVKIVDYQNNTFYF
jgi:hypothetical protein